MASTGLAAEEGRGVGEPRLVPLTNWQRGQKFGRFQFVPKTAGEPGGAVIIGTDWVRANITQIRCPQLDLIKKPGPSLVRIHRLAADSFLALWAAWERQGLLQYAHTWNGSFVPRFKRGTAGPAMAALSNHSWGTAFDINAALFPLGADIRDCARRVGKDLAEGQVKLAIEAEKFGWFCGGQFRSRPDWMHFEYVGEAK